MDPTPPPPERPPRLTMRQFWRDVGDEVLSLDRGLPYTFRQLLTAPGPTIRRWVDWRDPRITRPLRFFIVCVALTAAIGDADEALGEFVDGFMHGATGPEAEPQSSPAFRQLISDWRLLVMLLLVPAITAGTERGFRARGHTGAELWVFSLYVFAVCSVFTTTINALLPPLPEPWTALPVWIALGGSAAYYIWSCAGFFDGSRWRNALRASATVPLIAFVELLFVLSLFVFWAGMRIFVLGQP